MSASCVFQVVINPLRKFMSEFGIALPMAAARRYSLSPLGVGNHPKAMTHTFATPLVDIGALFGPASPDRDESDRAPMAAVTRYGYVAITGLPTDSLVDAATRRVLLHLLIAPEAEDWRRRRQAEDAGRHNVYRGWFTLQDEHSFGISIGPDVAHGAETVDPADPLRAATPLPPDSLLPGWCAAVREYYRGMERTGAALMGGIARGLGLPETAVLPAFADGISTLRLMRYPLRPASALAAIPEDRLYVDHAGARRMVILDQHADWGIAAPLAQDGVAGLQIRTPDDGWVDVPPVEGTLIVTPSPSPATPAHAAARRRCRACRGARPA
jgi:isopenicillin N synthase-like dioxygenase